ANTQRKNRRAPAPSPNSHSRASSFPSAPTKSPVRAAGNPGPDHFMSNVSPVTAATTGYETQTTTSALPPKTLSQEDFFQLLIAQMTAQDPMNPLSNAEFMGQMAQFSTLEQTRTLEANISAMRTEQQMVQANTLIGRNVRLQIGSRYVGGMV